MELEKVLEGIGIPVKYYEYAGVKPEYIVYNEESEQLADYGDNDPECHITWWQVHIFTPKTGKFREYKKAAEAPGAVLLSHNPVFSLPYRLDRPFPW